MKRVKSGLHPVIGTTKASKDMQYFNDAHRREAGDDYHTGKLVDVRNGIPSEWIDDGHPNIVAMLREAADLLEQAEDQSPMTLCDLYCFLHEAHRLIGGVQCWVVSKHYGDRDRNSAWFGRTATWIGCLDKEQAEAMAVRIEEHYATKYKGHSRDLFKVAWGKIDAHSVVLPTVKPEDYVRRLG